MSIPPHNLGTLDRLLTGGKYVKGKLDVLDMRNLPPVTAKQAVEMALDLKFQLDTRLSFKSVPLQAKYHDCAAAYEEISRMYQIAHEWEAAADAMALVAKYHVSMQKVLEAATYFEEAAEFYKRAKLEPEYVDHLEKAVLLYVEGGNLSDAAVLEGTLADISQSAREEEDALEHYDRAALYLREDGELFKASFYSEKVARLAGMTEEYERARNEWVRVAKVEVMHNLTQFNAREKLFNACLCQLLLSEETEEDSKVLEDQVNDFMAECETVDCMFYVTREAKYMRDLLASYLKPSMNDFADHTYNYDSVASLDYWQLTMLNRLKKGIAFELDIELSDDSEAETTDSEYDEYGEDYSGEDYSEGEDDNEGGDMKQKGQKNNDISTSEEENSNSDSD
eukprot:g2877.t1